MIIQGHGKHISGFVPGTPSREDLERGVAATETVVHFDLMPFVTSTSSSLM